MSLFFEGRMFAKTPLKNSPENLPIFFARMCFFAASTTRTQVNLYVQTAANPAARWREALSGANSYDQQAPEKLDIGQYRIG